MEQKFIFLFFLSDEIAEYSYLEDIEFSKKRQTAGFDKVDCNFVPPIKQQHVYKFSELPTKSGVTLDIVCDTDI